MKKGIAAMLVSLLLAAPVMVTAEGSREGAPVSGSAAQAPVVNVAAWFRSETGVPSDNYSLDYISQMTTTRIAFKALPRTEYETKLNLLLASGERPEIIAYGTDAMEYNLAKSSLLLPISAAFTKYPDLARSRPEATWDAMKHADGNIYAIPAQQMVLESAILYRADWLEKLGLSVPATLEDYYQVSEAVTKRDPDGNGKDDTYAFGGRGRIESTFDHIFAAFGVLPAYFREDKSGRLVEGAVTPQAKEALLYIKRMYDNGLIDPEFVTDSAGRLQQKTNAGRYGAAYDSFTVTDSSNTYGRYETWRSLNPTGRWVTGELLKGPETNAGLRSGSRRGWMKTSVLKDARNTDAALRVLSWLSSDEGRMFLNYGLEGKHYALASDGVVKPLLGAAEQSRLGINECYILMDQLYRHTSAGFQETLARATSVASPDVTDGWAESVPEISKYYGDLKVLIEATFLKMIVGEVPIEGGFETFVQEFSRNGGAALTGALNAEYARRKGR
jgi:ABC-type glycerol-3-phosphate transport system substrate-binding protein